MGYDEERKALFEELEKDLVEIEKRAEADLNNTGLDSIYGRETKIRIREYNKSFLKLKEKYGK